jgi:hypothetical protein
MTIINSSYTCMYREKELNLQPWIDHERKHRGR